MINLSSSSLYPLELTIFQTLAACLQPGPEVTVRCWNIVERKVLMLSEMCVCVCFIFIIEFRLMEEKKPQLIDNKALHTHHWRSITLGTVQENCVEYDITCKERQGYSST